MASSIQEFERAEVSAAAYPAAFAVRDMLRRPAGAAGLTLLVLLTLLSTFAPWLAGFDPYSIAGPALAPPSTVHFMGTDAIGRDLFSGVLFGTRTSLLVSAAVGLLSGAFGLAVGMTAGFFEGIADELIMRVAEGVQSLPRFFLAAVVIAVMGPGIDRLVILLGLTSWPLLARVVRAEVRATRHLDYVTATEALGASRSHLFRHVFLPQVLPASLILVGITIGQVMLIEASLGFVGLGDPGVMSLGVLAGQAQGFLRTGWWLALFPGIAVTAGVLAFNLTTDALSSLLQGR